VFVLNRQMGSLSVSSCAAPLSWLYVSLAKLRSWVALPRHDDICLSVLCIEKKENEELLVNRGIVKNNNLQMWIKVVLHRAG